MTWLIKLLGYLLPVLLKEFIKKKLPTMKVGKSDGKTESRLGKKIDDLWGTKDEDK